MNYYSLSIQQPVHRHRGVALVTVLFLFAIVVVILAALVTKTHMNINRSATYLESEQAYLLCLSGEEWARQVLYADFIASPNTVYRNQNWSKPGMVMAVENGYIEVSIEDEQGRFNIDNLVDASGNKSATAILQFQRLLGLAIPDGQHAAQVADELGDWLDKDEVGGVEAQIYSLDNGSYLPPNSPIVDVSEIAFLKDVDQVTWKHINDNVSRFLTAMPQRTLININTVSPEVLAAVANIDYSQAKVAVASISSNPNGFADINAALSLVPGASGFGLSASTFSVNSDYFRVRVRARFGDHYSFLESVIYRNHEKGGEMQVLRRDRSKRFIFPFSKDYNATMSTNDYDVVI